MEIHHYPRDSKGADKYFIAIPSYGPVEGTFAYSLACASQKLEREDITAEVCFGLGSCHVDDARNSLVHKFMDTDCTHLVFIDADISFDPDALLTLLRTEGDVVGGTYPFKKDDEGYPMQVHGTSYPDDETGLVPIAGLPTGFMKIQRCVFECLKLHCKQYQAHDNLRPVVQYFNRAIDSHGVRVGGDINFCHKVTDAGLAVLLIPNITLGHTGVKTWVGNLNVYQHMKVLGPEKALTKFLKRGDYDLETISKFLDMWGNEYAAPPVFHRAAIELATEASTKYRGDVLEFGSGASTVILATVPGITVHSLEHDVEWYVKVDEFCRRNHIRHNMHLTQLDEKGEYVIPNELKDKDWGLVIVDGPPRSLGLRQDAAKIKAPFYLIDDMESKYSRDLVRKLDGRLKTTNLGRRTIGVVRRENYAS